MSYSIRIVDPKTGKTLNSDSVHFIRGGTYAVGGTRELWLNITFNYGRFYRNCLHADSLKWLHDKTIEETLPTLSQAIFKMKGKPHHDYWRATEGNARNALISLINLALLAKPQAVWEVEA